MNIQPEQVRDKPFFNIDHLIFLFFSWRGRVNRKRYLLSGLLFVPLYLFLKFSSDFYPTISIVALIFTGYMGLMVNIKRAHDRDKSGHFCWLLPLPVIGLWPGIEFIFFKGTSGDNRFGVDMLSSKDVPENMTEFTMEDTIEIAEEQDTGKPAEKESAAKSKPETKDIGLLGIYLQKDSATAVCLTQEKKGYKILGCFSVQAGQGQEQKPTELVRLIAEGCVERGLRFSDIAVALDSVMFTQHSIHSEFTDLKQIAQTIRYDAEEILSIDASSLAVTFELIDTNESGSQLAIYAAKKNLISNLLVDFQNNNLDPAIIEPDIASIVRFTSHHFREFQDSTALFAILSDHCCYLMIPSKTQHAAKSRAFLIGSSQDKTQLLTREILLTLAATKSAEPINKLRIAQSGDGIDCEQLSRNTGLETELVQLAEASNTDPDALVDCEEPAGFAIAYGAAVGLLGKTRKVDFREDFAPYQGKKLLIERALKILSVTVTALLLTVGLYLQLRLLKTDQYLGRLREKLLQQYSTVMMGEKLPTKESPTSRLRRELVRIQKIKAGQLTAAGEESVSALLSHILQTLNETPKTVDLNIETVSISPKNITISGDTDKRQNTIKLIATIDRHPSLETSRFNYDLKNNRDEFHLTITPIRKSEQE